MADNIYRVPGQVGEQQINEAQRVAEVFQRTPENKPEMFRFIKERERRIFSYREAALEADKNRNKGILNALGWMRSDLTMTRLTDMESKIGGRIYDKIYQRRLGFKIWLHDKYLDGPLEEREEINHWFFVQPQVVNGRYQDLTIHYETQSTGITKWVNGIPYPLKLDEIETFSRLTELYEDEVRQELYPLDESIHEFEVEMEAESIVNPDTEEKMFSKEAVERMIENYKAKLALEEETRAMLERAPVGPDDTKDDFRLAA